MFAVLFPDWFAVNVPTLVPFFWIVSVPLLTVGCVIVTSVILVTCPKLLVVIWGTFVALPFAEYAVCDDNAFCLLFQVYFSPVVTRDTAVPPLAAVLLEYVVSVALIVLLVIWILLPAVNLSCFPEISWCAVMTVPKSTTPEVPLLAPFILMPVIVPVFEV